MKPTKRTAKKTTAKKTTAKRAVIRGSIEHKLMQLHNRIDKGGAQPAGVTASDKKWVWTLIEDIQNKRFTKLCKEDFEKCNGLWRAYA